MPLDPNPETAQEYDHAYDSARVTSKKVDSLTNSQRWASQSTRRQPHVVTWQHYLAV